MSEKTQFRDVMDFCCEWGFDVNDPEHNKLPASLYSRLMCAADELDPSKLLGKFMVSQTKTADGFMYVTAESFDELEDFWENFTGESPPESEVSKNEAANLEKVPHVFEVKEFSKYGDEPDVYACERCHQVLKVGREQTMQEAIESNRLESCDQKILNSVMD